MSASDSLAPASGAALVKIYLPEVGADGPAPDAVADVKPSLSMGRILVAEDDPVVRAMMLRALRDAGFVLVEAGDGREALRLVRADEAPLDLGITDVAMPAVDGCELARQLATIRPRSRSWHLRLHRGRNCPA